MSAGDKGHLDSPAIDTFTPARFRLKLLMLAVTISCVVFAAIYVLLCDVYESKQGIRCQYALWQVADMISLHIRQASSPPESWDDLKEEFLLTNDSYGTFTFEELKATVSINFQLLQSTFESESCCESEGNRSCVFVRCPSLSKRGVLIAAETTANNRIYRLICHLNQDRQLISNGGRKETENGVRAH